MRSDFTVESVNLSMKDPETQALLTANVYRLEGVNGGAPISIGQLVMALCLDRATDLEKKMIALMEEMDATSSELERLTAIETTLVNGGYPEEKDKPFLEGMGISTNLSREDMIREIESVMDSKNSFSQEKMIDLQSQTNKRDQAYDMIANVLKSFNTVLVGIANNM